MPPLAQPAYRPTEARVDDSVGPAGDVNHDGFADLLLRTTSGSILVAGSATGVGPVLTTSPVSAVISAIGDVNGDLFDDLVFGRQVRLGSPTGPASWS